MQDTSLNQDLLESIKRSAKQKKRADASHTHTEWLDILSAPHGFATFASLKRRVDEIAEESADERVWDERFASTMKWGVHPNDEKGISYSLPVPFEGGARNVPWPNCFARSSLFTCGEGPRRQFDENLITLDGPDMHFVGEELRVSDDESVLMALLLTIGKAPCGTLVEFTSADLDKAAGPLEGWGMPVTKASLARCLWRLVNCRLTVPDYRFDGPLLSYVDATAAPEQFAVRINPDFAKFYFPVMRLFG